MQTVTLHRLSSDDQGTFGRVVVGGHTFYSGELPWRDNATDVSCIPPGTYQCIYTLSPRFKRFLYHVVDLTRCGVRIHPANWMGDRALGLRSQLNGCIALGQRLGTLGGQKAVLLSGIAVTQFEAATGRDPFILEIVQ